MDRGSLFARVGQQLKHADQHAVVAQHGFIRNFLAKGNHPVAIMLRQVVRGAVINVAFTRLAARLRGRVGDLVHGLHVDRFGLGDARAAPVEQGQLERYGVTRRDALTGVRLADVTQVEHIDEARRFCQAQRRRGLRGLDPGGLDVEPFANRNAFDVVDVRRLGRQVGKALGQQIGAAGSPQAHQPGQVFAGGDRALAGPGNGSRRLCFVQLLPGEIELAQVSRLRHAAGQRRARLGRRRHLPRIGQSLDGAKRIEIGVASVCGMLEDVACHHQPGLLETPALDASGDRCGQQADQAQRQRALDVDRVARVGALERERGILQPARLDQVGVDNTDVPVSRLQRPVVQQGDLHRIVGRQRGKQLCGDQAVERARVIVIAQQARILAEPVFRQRRHCPKTLLA